MSPPALTAPLNGRLGLAPNVCFDDCAKVMTVPAARRERMAMKRMCRSLNAASFYPDLGCQAPIKLVQPRRPETIDFLQCGGGRVQQRLHVHTLAARGERRKIVLSACQHVHGAMVIELAEMMERDADLQDTLIQIADVACFGAPEPLERFVLLEELAAIELRDALEQERGRRIVAGHALSLALSRRSAERAKAEGS